MKQLFQCSLIYTSLNTGTIFNTTILSTEQKLVLNVAVLSCVKSMSCTVIPKTKQSAHCVSLPCGCRQAWGWGVWNHSLQLNNQPQHRAGLSEGISVYHQQVVVFCSSASLLKKFAIMLWNLSVLFLACQPDKNCLTSRLPLGCFLCSNATRQALTELPSHSDQLAKALSGQPECHRHTAEWGKGLGLQASWPMRPATTYTSRAGIVNILRGTWPKSSLEWG